MLRIALCDDETDARDALRFQLEKALIEETEKIVYEFSAGANAVSWLKKHPGEVDLLFLDIEMKGLNGMETARRIRAFDQNIMIAFLTGYPDYVFDGYSVGALDYLVKPAATQRLIELLHRVRAKLEQEKDLTFSFKNADGTWRFLLRDILYFYSDRRKVTLVTEQSEYAFYARLDEIEAQTGHQFVRIHQRYLINPAWVDYLGSSSVTIGDKKLPCSRNHREAAAEKIARFMMNN